MMRLLAIVMLVLVTCDADRLRKLEDQMKSMKAFQSFALTRLDIIETDVGSITDRVSTLEALVNKSVDDIGDIDSKSSKTEDNIGQLDVKPEINDIKNILRMYRHTFEKQKKEFTDVNYVVKETLSVFQKNSSSVMNSLVNSVNDHVKKSGDNISATLEHVNNASVKSGRLLRSGILNYLDNISSEVRTGIDIQFEGMKQESNTTVYAIKSEMEKKVGELINSAKEVVGIIHDKRSTIEDGIMGTITALHSSWNDWSAWSQCSQSCDKGSKGRHRKCSAPPPLTDGTCTGNETEAEECVMHEFCPHWSEWTLWSQCSQTCDNGTITRDRTCQTPASLHLTCQGQMTESQICVTSVECPLVACDNLDIDFTSRNPSTSAIAYDTEITYACVEGYKHTDGDLTRTCQADGNLSDNAPVCTRPFISQWVESVVDYSSEAASYQASQTVGEPDVYPVYGTDFKAWSPLSSDSNAFIEVGFSTSVMVTAIEIYETYAGGVVTGIKCFQDGAYHSLYVGEANLIEGARIFAPALTDPCVSNRLRIEVFIARFSGGVWLEIDAIRLNGTLA